MALKHLTRTAPPPPTPGAERPTGITCAKYVRGEGKRCVHFKASGACELPEEFMCVEWMKANGPVLAEEQTAPARPAVAPQSLDLFGVPGTAVRLPAKARAAPPPAEAPVEVPEPTSPVELRGLTTDDIASFKALGVEVQLKSQTYGDLWLVPSYTGQSRKELTPEHAATVMRVLEAFPGAHVISFEKHSQPERPERLPRRP